MEPEERAQEIKRIAYLRTIVEEKGMAGAIDLLVDVCQDFIDDGAFDKGPWTALQDILSSCANKTEIEEATFHHDKDAIVAPIVTTRIVADPKNEI